MFSTATLRRLPFEEALAYVDEGAAFIDLRPIDDYLDVHVPGSLPLLYEFGPGMATRARDCLPLNLALVLLDSTNADMANAAASLQGKGFSVLGTVEDGINEWAARRGSPSSTEVVPGADDPNATVLHVGDPGARPIEGATFIPIERLWSRTHEVPREAPVAIVAGYGVRAALAVGMLERAGLNEILFWRTRA